MMAHMMDAYGRCMRCHEEGALWKYDVQVRQFFRPWKWKTVTRYYCDECDPPRNAKQENE